MKKEFQSLIKYLVKNKYRLGVFVFSLLILIIGSVFIKFFIMLIIALLINMLWFIPYLIQIKHIDFKKIKPNFQKKETSNTEKNEIDLESSDDMKRIRRTAPRKYRNNDDNLNNKKKKTIFKKILFIILIMFIVFVLAAIIFFTYIALSAGKFNPEKLYTKEASILYDNEGKEFAQLGTEMRKKIKYKDLSEEMINAVVATEDSRFFEHNGFDLPRFLKASFGQALGQNAGGASTLTMQVSKNQFTSTTSSGIAGIIRKFTDIYMAIFQIERNYSKEQIMEFYVNSYYLGSGSYGVEQAAKTYFNKNAKDLNLSESAMIAGMFQSPVVYDPNLNPDKTEARRLTVLKLMKRHGYINNDEYEMAKKMTVDKIVIKGRSAHSTGGEYQGFIDTVAMDVQEETGYDPYSYSMKIYTTMDRSKQDKITDIINGKSFNWENDKVDAGIAVLDTKTGALIAIGAGRNREGAKAFNNATMTKRQIGSTAKPLFDYGPAIEYLNWNTSHSIIDAKYTYSDGTEINNWDGGYKGVITIRQALVDSRNIPALKTFQSVKNSDIVNFVTKLGLSPEISNGVIHEAHAIGGYNGESPLTVAAAYAAFGNEGTYNQPHSYTKIEFEESGKTIEFKEKKEKVMSKDTAYMVSDMLVDTGKNALGRYNNINGAQFAAKTGTTNFDEKTMRAKGLPSSAVNDLWIAGYNPDYSIAVWYGYDKISDGYNRFGSSQNSRLFQAVAKDFFKSSAKFNKPDTIVDVTVEKNTGGLLLPSSNTPDSEKSTELFKSSAKPTEVSNRFNQLDNVSNAKASVSGHKANITFKPIGTPQALSDSYWKPIVEKAYPVDTSNFLSYIKNYNSSVLGNVVYNIYQKTASGLTKVATVNDGNATVKLSGKSPVFIIKTSYSNFSGAESGGVEVKVDYNGASASDANITLKEKKGYGTSPINWDLGNTNYADPGITVMLDGENITSECDITPVVTFNGIPSSISQIGSETGTYIISYKVIYDGEDLSNSTVTRKINVS